MSLLTWGPGLVTGNGDIDTQHQKLLGLVNDLNNALGPGHTRESVSVPLDKLIAYVLEHFAFEEQMMDKYQVPSAAAHKAEHAQLLADVTAFKAKFDAGAVGLALQLMPFLKDWLQRHIPKTDKAFAAELAAKGVRAAA